MSSSSSAISFESIPAQNHADYNFKVGQLFAAALHSLDAQQLKSVLQNAKCKPYFASKIDPDSHYSDFHYSAAYSLAMSRFLSAEEAAKRGQEPTVGSKDTFTSRKSQLLSVMLSEWDEQIQGASNTLLKEHFKNSNDDPGQILITEQLWKYRNEKSPVSSLDQTSKENLFDMMEQDADSTAKEEWLQAKRLQFSC